MKKFGYVLAGLLVLIVVGALAAPSFIDWNAYKPRIQAEAERAMGRTLAIDGDLSATLLPLPALSVEGVRLGNDPRGAAETMARIEALTVKVALLPLLTGKVQVDRIEVVRPTVALEVYSDGSNNWTFAPAPTDGETLAPPTSGGGDGGGATVDGGEDGAFDLRLDNLHIEDGTLTFRDLGAGTVETVSGITADAGAESLTGPYRFDGRLTARGLTLAVEARAGSLADDKAAPINATVTIPGSDASASVNLLLSGLSEGLSVRGKVSADGADLGRLVAAATGAPAPPALAQGFAIEGAVTASATAVRIDNLALGLGDSRATGAVAATLGETPSVDVALAFARLALDPFIDPAPATRIKATAPPAGTEVAKPATPAAPEAPFALPTGVTVSLDVTGEAATWRDLAIRQPRLNARLADGRLIVNEVRAALPGGGSLAASGALDARDGKPYISAAVRAAADDLRTLLGAVAVDVSTVPADRLRRFSLAVDAKGTQDALQVSALKATLDTTTLTGAATLRLTGRPAFGVSATVDTLNVDAYLPAPAPASDSTGGKGGAAPSSQPPATASSGDAPLAGLEVLNTFDANVQAKVGRLTQGGRRFDDIALDASLVKGKLTVNSARIGDFAGASLTAQGGLSGFGAEPAFDAFNARFVARDPAKWSRAMGLELPVDPAKLANMAVDATLTGTLAELATELRAEAGGLVANARGPVRDLLSAPRFALDVEAGHSSLRKLIALVAPDYRPADPNLGAFALQTKASGSLEKIDLADLRLRLGPTNLAGTAEIALTGARPKITADLKGDELDVARFLPADRTAMAPEDLPFGVRAGVEPVAFKTAPAPAAGTSAVKPVAAPRWSREPLDLSGLSAVDANVDLSLVNLVYGGIVISEPTTTVDLANGTAKLERFAGSLFGGTIDGSGLVAGTGVPRLEGALKVSAASVGKALLGAAGVDIADGLLDFDTKIATQGRSLHELIKGLNGQAAMKVLDGLVRGFDLGRVNEQVKNLDNVGGVLHLLQTGMTGGQTRFKTVAGTFDVSGGAITTRDLALVSDAGRGDVVARIDLADWTIDATGGFTLAALPNAPPFSMKLTGPLDKPRRIIDPNALQQYLIQAGIGRLIEKKGGKAGGILQQILPGAKPAPEQRQPAPSSGSSGGSGGWGDYDPNAPADTQPQQQRQPEPSQPQPSEPAPRKPKPEDLFNILKGLGG